MSESNERKHDGTGPINEIEDGIDVRGGGYQHGEAEMREHLKRAQNFKSCAHAIFPARNKRTGEWCPLVMFFDQDGKTFAHAFLINEPVQARHIIGCLTGCLMECERRNQPRGEA